MTEAKQTFLYISGLSVEAGMDLAESVRLQPAAIPDSFDIRGLSQPTMDELAIATLFLPKVRSELCVGGSSGKDLAIRGWNALWDVVLLSALSGAEAVCNLYGSCSASELRDGAQLSVGNRHLYGFRAEPCELTAADAAWLQAHYSAARDLLDQAAFQDAAAALWSYR